MRGGSCNEGFVVNFSNFAKLKRIETKPTHQMCQHIFSVFDAKYQHLTLMAYNARQGVCVRAHFCR